ncbi:MAG: ABC transporter ATP-binding protein, partial [Cohaesibacteraceae bacterium]|nr:ABC transporter ATP-binding protein [Cohaesibacteraceae bacterium]
ERAKKAILLEGDLPSPFAPPSGCVFRTRCSRAKEICAQEIPLLSEQPDTDTHSVACHFPG